MTPRHFDPAEPLPAGTCLIEASAGTGKTYTIAGLVLRLLLEKDLSVTRILVVTFTVAATEELRDRVRRRIREAATAFETGSCLEDDAFLQHLLRVLDPAAARSRLEAALREFDEAPIFTIHGFCQRVLRENAFESGLFFDAELAADQEPFLQEVVDDYWRRELCAGHPLVASFALKRGFTPKVLVGLLRSYTRHPFLELLPPEAAPERAERERAFLAAYEAVREAWPAARTSVCRILSEDKGLSRSKDNFGPEPLRACFDGLDRCFAGPDVPPGCFASLRKIASESLRKPGVVKTKHAPPEHDFFDRCQALAEAEDALFLSLEAAFLSAAREELAAKKRRRNVQGFDDLMTDLLTALRGPGGPALARALRERFGAALIDEFQDTDPVQYEIFDRIFGRRAEEPSLLFLIGDPKQAIYGFRGADIFAYLEAAGSGAIPYTLPRNWRSEPELLKGVSALFEGAGRPFVFEGIGFPEVAPGERKDRAVLRVEGEAGPSFRTWLVPRTEENSYQGWITKGWAARALPRAVAAEICRLLALSAQGKARLGDRSLEPGDLAVLTRTNQQARWAQDALRAAGLPSVLWSTESLFSSREALEMERLLLALAEPGSEGLVRAAVATDLVGVGGEELHGLLEDEASWERWLGRFRAYHELWAGRGFLPMFRQLLTELGARERLLSYVDGERRLTNVLHVAEVLHRATREEKLGMAGLVRWLAERRADGEAAEEHQLRLESDEKAVKLVTVHRSKGLEYPVVFCPFSWEGSELRREDRGVKAHLPPGEPGSPTRFVLDLGSRAYDAHRALAEVESLAENVRLLYVALTRAKNRCTFVWGGFNTADTSAPAYLLHHRDGRLPPEGGLSALRARLKGLGDADLRAAVEGTGCGVEPLPEGLPRRYESPGAREQEVAARGFRGQVRHEWRAASYSHLVAGVPAGAEEEAPDRDAGTGGGGATLDAVSAFPGGVRAGSCLHAILEHLDFAEEGGPGTAGLVDRALRDHGFGPEWGEAATRMAENAARTSLDPEVPDLVLSRVPAWDRWHEVEFTVPLRQEEEALSPGSLAAAFRRFGGAELEAAAGPGVPERLGRLEFSPVRGYLRGFMDLVFRWEGRYCLVDWKSNRLGDGPDAYAPAALAEAMRRGHYVLQYHLYAVALHRHLQARLAGYEPERHFGGVYYVFLRGLDPSRPGRGVFRDRLSGARLEGLAACLTGRGEGA